MYDVEVGVVNVVTNVGGEDTKIRHQGKLTTKWYRFLMGESRMIQTPP